MDLKEYCDRMHAVWIANAPSYVQATMSPARNTLRDLHALGVTPEQFDEALEIAFQTHTVTKRKALYYAYAIVKRLVAEDE